MKYTLSAVLASLPIITLAVGQAASSSGSNPPITSASASSSTTDVGLSSTVSSSSSAAASVYPSPTNVLSSSSASAIAATSCTINIAASNSTYISSSSVAPVALPSIAPIGNYYFAGCYVEPAGSRALSVLSVAADDMTLEACSAACAERYQYFGLEYGRECWCGYTLSTGTLKTSQDQCDMPCGGSSTEMCGAPRALSLYSSTRLIPAPPTTPIPSAVPAIGPYISLGCYTEAANYQRALTGLALADPNMTNEMCATSCAGFGYFGYCGNALGLGSVPAASTDCYMDCDGNSLEPCGGPLRLNLYFNPSAPTPSSLPSAIVPSSTSVLVISSSSSLIKPISSSSLKLSSSTNLVKSTLSSTSIKSSSSSSSSSLLRVSSTSSTPKSTSLSKTSSSSLKPSIASTSAKITISSSSSSFKPTSTTKSTLLTLASSTSKLPTPTPTWKSIGCYQDTSKHTGLVAIKNAKTMNVEICISSAMAAATARKPTKYAYVGLENGSTCFGATVAPTATSLTAASACTMTCAGNKKGGTKEVCGGKGQYNLYASV